MTEFKLNKPNYSNVEDIEIYLDSDNTGKYYFLATILDTEYEVKVPALSSLDEVLSHAGECDNDSILEIDGINISPLYKWSTSSSSWHIVN